jgi:carbonic anhydrase/acetyltransferase-like protein (isoleucine patch superfamily)
MIFRHVPLAAYEGRLPRLGPGVFVAPTAWLTGDIEVGEDSSFWFGVVARGDVNRIRIGKRTNVQDGSVLHVAREGYSLEIGDDVVVGHAVVLHACRLEDSCLIGIGARVLDGAVVESEAQVGAGAVVPPGMRVPSGALALGVPARVVRSLSTEERATIHRIAGRYVELKNAYGETVGWCS